MELQRGTVRLLKVGLVYKLNGVRDWLCENCFRGFNIRCANLEPYTADHIGHLPVQTDEVFVFQKAKDACRLDDAACNDRLGQIAILSEGDQVAEFSFVVHSVRKLLQGV